MKKSILARIYLLYTEFTVVCNVAAMAVHELRTDLFRIWYTATALVWIIYAVNIIFLLAKLFKISKLKIKMKHWKE